MHMTINGKLCQAQTGQTIMEAARGHGVYIPALCFHVKTGIASRCRACVVEVKGSPGLRTACSTAAEDGMVITTNSRRVLHAQRQIIELLLSSGIHNCAACSRYGNCELQDAAYYLGIDLDMTGPEIDSPLVSWFEAPYWNEAHGLIVGDPKRTHRDITPDIDDSDAAILVDRDKCIACGRCVEICRIMKRNVVHFALRGHHTRIIFDNDVSLAQSKCDHCGECLPLCPVGALTAKQGQ